MEDNKLDDKGEVKVEPGAEPKKPEDKKEDGYSPEFKAEPKKPEEVPTELTEEQVLKYHSNRMGKDIKSFDDLAVEKIVEKNVEYASEQLQEIDRYVRETKRTAKDWFNTQATDYSKMTSEQLVKEDIKAEFPNLTSKQVDIYFNNKYHIDSENYDEDEAAVAQVELEMDSKKILTKVLDIQSKFRKPIETKEEKKADEKAVIVPLSTKADVDPNIEYKRVFVEDAATHIGSLEKINIGQFEVDLDEGIKENLVNANSNLDTFFVDNFYKDGKWDRDRLNTILFLAQEGNLEAVTGNIESNLVGQGMEKVIENRKNLKLEGSRHQDKGDKTPKQIAEDKAFEDAVMEGFGNKN